MSALDVNVNTIEELNKILEESYERSQSDEGVPLDDFFSERMEKYADVESRENAV